jgi:hypothetical protein
MKRKRQLRHSYNFRAPVLRRNTLRCEWHLKGVRDRVRCNANNGICRVGEGISRPDQGYEFHSGARLVSRYIAVQNAPDKTAIWTPHALGSRDLSISMKATSFSFSICDLYTVGSEYIEKQHIP